MIEEKLIERPRIEVNNRRERNNSFSAPNVTDAYDPGDEFDLGGGNFHPSSFGFPPSESGYSSHSTGTPFSQSTYTPASMFGGDMGGQGFTPSSEMGYHQHHSLHHQQQPPPTPYSMPPPHQPPPPHFNNSFVNFDPQIPPPPLPSEPPPSTVTTSSHYKTSQQTGKVDHYHHERTTREFERDHHRGNRHYDRDGEYSRDHERDRDGERDRDHEKHRDRERMRDRHRGREGSSGSSNMDDGERHSASKPVEKLPRPKTPEPEPEKESRFMSLESRIQSLLRGSGVVEEDDTSHSSRSQDIPQVSLTTPHTPTTPDSRQHFAIDSYNSSQNNIDNSWPHSSKSVPVVLDNAQPPPTLIQTNKDDGSDMDVDDDDDRMSLSSISSGEEKLQVNPPVNPNINSSGMPLGPFSQPLQNLNQWQPCGNPFSFGFGGHNFNMNGPFNQGFISSPFPNGMVDQNAPVHASFLAKEEEEDKLDKQFSFVLSEFVQELKAVMQKDLCKKMVETSAFKAFESWWDSEEQKSKVFSFLFFKYY